MDHNCINKNPWKFHDSSLLYTIVSLIHPTNLLWWPPRSKKLTAELVLYQVWIILVWLWISKSFMFLPQSAQYLHLYPSSYIFCVIWPKMTSWTSKRAIPIISINQVWFAPILSSIYQSLIYLWRYMAIPRFFPYFSCSDLWWSPQGQTRSHTDEFYIKFAS